MSAAGGNWLPLMLADPIGLPVIIAGLTVGTAAGTGFMVGRLDAIEKGWADGCEQVAAWWAALLKHLVALRKNWLPRLRPLAIALWLFVLALVLPAHGEHRREVTG